MMIRLLNALVTNSTDNGLLSTLIKAAFGRIN